MRARSSKASFQRSYECHITCYLRDSAFCEQVAKEKSWKTSQIASDPLLGDDTYYYLTAHSSDMNFIKGKMRVSVDRLRQLGAHVVREKIEETVHDVHYALY